MEQKFITDNQGNKILPITHVNSVRDDNGNTIGSLMGAFEDEVRGLVDTPHENYVTVAATSQTTAAEDVLPDSGQSADTIYRVSNWDGSANSGAGAFDVTTYSEYAWDDVSSPNKYIFLCKNTQIGEVFDITVYNNNTKYADLASALGTNGANVPVDIRRGGMSVKFVCSSDNKYEQYRLMSDTFNTTETNWQGVDDELIGGSKNLVEGGVVHSVIFGKYEYQVKPLSLINDSYYPTASSGTRINPTPGTLSGCVCSMIECNAGDKFKIYGRGTSSVKLYAFTNANNIILDTAEGFVNYRNGGHEITAPEGSAYLYINFVYYDSSADKLEEYVFVNGLIQDIAEEYVSNEELENVLHTYNTYGEPLSFVITYSHSGTKDFYLEPNKKYKITLNCVGSAAELAKLRYFNFLDEAENIIYQENINTVQSGVDYTFDLSLGNVPVKFIKITRLSTFSEDINVTISTKSYEEKYITTEEFEEKFDEEFEEEYNKREIDYKKNSIGLPINVFGDILPLQFKQKLFSGDSDILIAVQGDSIVGMIDRCDVSTDPSHDAPGAQYQSFVSLVQKNVSKVKPFYNRLDSIRNNTDFFTKEGTWEQATDATFGPKGTPSINDSFKEASVSCLTYRSNSVDASVSFDFDADKYDKCNIVFSMNIEAATAALAISEGNGKMLVSIDRNTWVEANGFSHSQDSQATEVTTTSNGVAKCERHRRLWMKKVSGVTGVLHITYSKVNNDSKYFYCWGTEMYFGQAVFFDNIGRGGRTIERLSQNISDIFDRNPDLTIVELPFLNDADHFDYESWISEIDRYFINESSKKSYRYRSQNYTKNPLVIMLSHLRVSAFDENDNAVMMPIEYQLMRTSPAYNIWKQMCGYLQIQLHPFDNVVFIDMLDQFLNEAIYRYGSIHIGMQKGNMTADGVHLNQRGSNVYTKYISPLFYI